MSFTRCFRAQCLNLYRFINFNLLSWLRALQNKKNQQQQHKLIYTPCLFLLNKISLVFSMQYQYIYYMLFYNNIIAFLRNGKKLFKPYYIFILLINSFWILAWIFIIYTLILYVVFFQMIRQYFITILDCSPFRDECALYMK